MKRRGFLGIFGAAITTPFLPAIGTAAPSGAALKTAIAHAQRFPVISVGGLSKLGGFSTAQAEVLIKELAANGMVKLVGPSRTGTVRAASKVYLNDHWGIARTAQQRQSLAKRQARTQAARKDAPPKPTLAPWIAHLHDLCRARGMALNPRCFVTT